MKLKKILKNISFAITSNLISLIVSTLVILIIPKIIGVYEYGIWQIFIFYNSYVGLLHFGWIDGIYLRYGGQVYEQLDKKKLHNQLIFFFILQLFLSIMTMLISNVLLSGPMLVVFRFLSVTILVVNCKDFFQFILQMTNRISTYSTVNIIGSILYALSLTYILFMGNRDYKAFILCFILSQCLALLISAYFCRSILFEKISKFTFDLKETYQNISVGLRLVFANIAAMLIIGTVRLGIQVGWSITDFAKISLMLSISNLLMLFINSVSLVLFPLLRQSSTISVEKIYTPIKQILVPFLLFSMLLYYPIVLFVPVWLPKYASSLQYLSVLFPMIVYQAKFEILTNTVLKVLRLENKLLLINVATLIFTGILTLCSVLLLHNLFVTILLIILSMVFRDFMAEILVNSSFSSNSWSSFFRELIIVIIFIVGSSYFSVFTSMVIYIVTLLLYLFIMKNSILNSVEKLKFFGNK